jgi:hypothetical protein
MSGFPSEEAQSRSAARDGRRERRSTLPHPELIERPSSIHPSRLSLMAHVPFKTAQAVSEAMTSWLRPFADGAHALMSDDVKGFAPHLRMAYLREHEGSQPTVLPENDRFSGITPKILNSPCTNFITTLKIPQFQNAPCSIYEILHLHHNSAAFLT